MICQNCGTEVADGAVSCPVCGAPTIQYQAPNQGYQDPAQGYQDPNQGYQDPNAYQAQGYQDPNAYQSQGYQDPNAYDPSQGYQNTGAYNPNPGYAGVSEQDEKDIKTAKTLGIISLILSIICCGGGIVTIVLSIIGLVKLNGKDTSEGDAKTAKILCIVSLAIYGVVVVTSLILRISGAFSDMLSDY